MNTGFARTRGTLLAWLNADDVYMPGAVSRAVAALQAHPAAALVYGQADFIDRRGVRLGPCPQVEPFDLARLIHQLDFIVQPATLFRRSAFEAVGGLDATLRYCLDYDLWIKLALRYPVHYEPAVLACARIYPETDCQRGAGAARRIRRMIGRYGRRRHADAIRRDGARLLAGGLARVRRASGARPARSGGAAQCILGHTC
ncbi:MAG: glycosyltransferase [Kouleothrix sp.]